MGNVYLLTGDRYLVERKLKEIIQAQDVDEFNTVTYDTEEVELSLAITDAQTIPFMSDHKVVVIKNELFEDREQTYEEFLSLLDNSPTFLTLILTPFQEMDKRTKIYKRIQAVGEVFDFSELDQEKLKNAIVTYLEKRQIRINEQSLTELLQRTEYSSQNVMNELHKIETYYKPGDMVYVEELMDLVSRNVEQDVFQLVNAVVDKNVSKAMEICNDLLLTEDSIRLLGLLTRKFREINYAKTLLSKGYTDQDLMQFFKASKGRLYYIKKTANQANAAYISEQLDRLSETELNIKKGLLEGRVALELFLLQI